MQKRRARNIGSVQRSRLYRAVKRRSKQRHLTVIERYPRQSSERIEHKTAMREKYIDQVALDKLQGLESGRICRALYRKLKPRQAPQRQPRPNPLRTASSYRGARLNAVRGSRKSLVLRGLRKSTGETRSQVDRRRILEAV